MLASSFHVRKNTERVLNASSDRNEQNVPNVRSNLDLSNGTLLRRHRTLVNGCDWHTMQFLSPIINFRDDVFGLQSYPVTARVERYCVVVFWRRIA